ncbi:MAG TPA: F0F1 ATP synthase subunit gamma [Acidimicrobiales bacterium]|nr:F0F1 ATP synthase subunit gamma [Acidimicrobiales bacterium]
MAGGQERVLRRRIRSVESTKKITRAMELIAGSRIVRAQQAIAAARPYVQKMGEVVEHLAGTPDASSHPLFRDIEGVQKVAIVLITADRGLAGGYNSSIIRTVERMMREHRASGRDVQLVPLGRKGVNYFRYRRQPILAAFTGIADRPSYEDARRVVAAVMPPFEMGDLDQIELVYTRFVSMGTQTVTVKQLVPLAAGEKTGTGAEAASGHRIDYEFEPEPSEILDRLLPSWLEAEVLAAMLESSASEHAARQRAMKAATDNADELIKNLRRVMNRARQDSITTEIMEIVGGAEALRQVGVEDGSGSYNETFDIAAESA